MLFIELDIIEMKIVCFHLIEAFPAAHSVQRLRLANGPAMSDTLTRNSGGSSVWLYVQTVIK